LRIHARQKTNADGIIQNVLQMLATQNLSNQHVMQLLPAFGQDPNAIQMNAQSTPLIPHARLMQNVNGTAATSVSLTHAQLMRQMLNAKLTTNVTGQDQHVLLINVTKT
jgi:hypothetical protein